jgi:hypothetical protein
MLKRFLWIVCLTGIAGGTAATSPAEAKVTLFTVYAEAGDPSSEYFVPSGWMGDHADVALTTDHPGDPHSGKTCIKVVYRRSPAPRAGWAAVLWQHPENNWGDKKDAGIDLSATDQLVFWARGEKGGERIEEFKVGGTQGPYPDSDTGRIGPIILTDTWQRYVIDLSGKDLTHIIGGFAWSTNLQANPDGCTFYLDDIRFE